MTNVLAFSAIRPTDRDAVGGKGLSLGLLASANLPVPPGFCVTTAAYRSTGGKQINESLFDEIKHAYTALGQGCVAVRSSATAEDGSETSFAGQQETILGVEGAGALKAAIERCWGSLHTERARAYRAKQGVDEHGLAMAVVVQRLVEADVAGVLFTRDPFDVAGTHMRIEASWGLGEAVVSGRVTPDRFQVERATGVVRDRQAGYKTVRITRHGEEAVPEAAQTAWCLDDTQLAALADLGRRVEAFYGEERDIEWAIADRHVWLLQARPITTIGAADRERVRQQTIERLRNVAAPTGTVWSRTNLVEVLPEPTPLTWGIVTEHLLSGGGGTGQMYADFGFKPDPALASMSAYDLIGGRPYLNLRREPHLQAAKPLFGYPLQTYKAEPHLALDPKPDTSKVLGGFGKWFRMFGMIMIASKIATASKKFAGELRTTHIPAFVAACDAAPQEFAAFDDAQLVQHFRTWVTKTLVEFARHSLKPTLLAQFSWQFLEQQLTKVIGAEQAKGTLASLSQGAQADPQANLPQAVIALTHGELSQDAFLKNFGHRGPNEMELAAPRWAEDPRTLPQRTTHAPVSQPKPTSDILQTIATQAKWNKLLTNTMTEHVTKMQTYLGLRETSKHYLMRGYAYLRRILLELDRRCGLHGGIFYLRPSELDELLAQHDLKPRIAERRRTRTIELSMEVPAVLFSDDLEALGRPLSTPAGAEQMQGIPLSAGSAEGKALVLTEPSAAPAETGYILVCPSTDPAWVPLFVHAKGLVMESGGTLSHGAIVAREFGLPAVAGLLGVHQHLRTGQTLRVDGTTGRVTVLDS